MTFTWGFARRFAPGCHMTGFQPSPGRCALTLEACWKDEAGNMQRSPQFRGAEAVGGVVQFICGLKAAFLARRLQAAVAAGAAVAAVPGGGRVLNR